MNSLKASCDQCNSVTQLCVKKRRNKWQRVSQVQEGSGVCEAADTGAKAGYRNMWVDVIKKQVKQGYQGDAEFDSFLGKQKRN